ncbi:cortical protein marker for cell polarity-domain-containing protein [Dichotomopilus funicola]|uniref:Cortical protein marker for cell polarity-domain-containing protein n=1 Tax=Dichotomopilus funicola TaxID=1934379 RepID=A0AAN6V0I8_9PEZI|nr:cortical protein marker for cell polarity-domain-containing protein [Dichotomopilus funicola]
MRLPFGRRHAARSDSFSSRLSLFSLCALAASPAAAISFTPVPSPNLDLSQLGRVVLAGDFSGISLYQFEEQNVHATRNNNGSEQLLARMPNALFAPIANTDATIRTMCTLDTDNGTVVILGGNFTSIRGPDEDAKALQSNAIALFNPDTAAVTPLPGLSGQVNSLLCDQDKKRVYLGGSFVGANSTNALAWEAGKNWVNLPFAGFNGPVTSIAKASNGNIIFGGSFTGLGNASTPSTPDGQIINLSTASITTGSSATTAGFSDPKNIICKTGGEDGSGNTWLLQDNAPGFWDAKFRHGFRPTKLRLYNTHQDGRGTKTWRFTAMPINGIMNFTYIDPVTHKNATCTSECPLSDDKSVEFQDFHFVNLVGMNQFRFDISAFYGNGGGLDGLELFADDISSYAVDDFNEPTCAGLEFPSTATSTGPWTVTPSYSSTAEYLSALLTAPISNNSASVVFSPDIRESGHYSVDLYTPGCLQDNTCATRGQVKISGQMTADPTKSVPIDVDLYQTNNFDKYDQVYFGFIDASSGGFRPSVTLTPRAGQDLAQMTIVAQRIGFTLINSTGGLNGLYEYAPGAAVNASDFMKSKFNRLGGSFDTGSTVKALGTVGDATYIAGNFTGDRGVRNIVALEGDDEKTLSLDGGLDGAVNTLFINGTNIFVGGAFAATSDGSTKDLHNVAIYDTSKKTWKSLGAGVSGTVSRVVGMTMNVTSTTPEVVVSVNGEFDELRAFGGRPAVKVNGFGIWVPSQNNWLQNLEGLAVESVDGILSASILNLAGQSLYAGSLSASSLGVNGAASLGSDTLGRLPVDIQPSTDSSSSGVTKRADTSAATSDIRGVTTGVFDVDNGRNLTILGGHFTAKASDGSTIHNLLISDGADKDSVKGLGDGISANSTFLALAVEGDILFAGGKVEGTVNGDAVSGLVTYNLASRSFNTQPPALSGGNSTVSSIAVRSATKDVYVAGSFTSAGSLGCNSICFFSTTASQWNQAGRNLDGTISSLLWASDNILLAGGSLTINSTATAFLGRYDTSTQTWNIFPGAEKLPGPVTVLTAGTSDGNQIWAAGTSAQDGSAYLMKYDGSAWQRAGESALQPGTDIRGLQIFSLAASHDESPLLNKDEALLITGSIVLADFGPASAVLYTGNKKFTPFALTTTSSSSSSSDSDTSSNGGSIARVFSERNSFFSKSNANSMPLGFVVLIGLAIALGLMLLLVVGGLALDRLRKRREGYVPAPTSMIDRGNGMARIPPHELLEGLGRRGGVPQV